MHIKHGLTIGISRLNDQVFLELQAIGKLTHEDYETITPMLESAIAGIEKPKVNILVDARKFEGWELRAAWDDLKLGLKHGNEFQRMAVVGTKVWQKYAAKISSWFIAGDAKYFEDMDSAVDWIKI